MPDTITVTKTVAQLRTVFNRIHSVGFISTPTAPGSISTITCWLPILEGSVSFDTGQPDITEVKLTTGEKWTTMTEAGDADISMQCSSFDSTINDIFLTKKTGSTTINLGTSGATLDGNAYTGAGYSLESKKVTGALVLRDESKDHIIVLPNVEIFASVGIEEDNPGYFNLKITPLPYAGTNASVDDGCSIYFLNKLTA